jgi:hypothetical protein
MNLRNIVINTSLAVSGVALWSYGAARLASGGDFEYRPNPLGLKMSPYGQVIALAVQGGIDSDWHGAERRMPGETCGSCGQDHGADEIPRPVVHRPHRGRGERANQPSARHRRS